ncbi:DNA endonuclease RBBP8 [Lampris incognitus]|uniref:DNA endonuclease RBBP8 n=1 Tax=Lampris incognitus TaxID=2546036 RepID=UPI0024B54F2D|nr:DNA endonuclease RBBP8 [Lampris incognitus]
MNISGQSCSSTPASNEAMEVSDLFGSLLSQLAECHQNALRELWTKVGKLKKERCLDAQRLEEFYSRNQQLKEQHKTLQDTISLLEERLRAGICDQCAILEECVRNKEQEIEKALHLIAGLKSEKISLQDENGKLNEQLEKLQASLAESQHTFSPEQEEGVIPDSPLLQNSLPLANKLKRRKKNGQGKQARHAETPLLQSPSSFFNEPNKEPLKLSKSHGEAVVLVPNTCELDASPTSPVNHNLEVELVAETCALDLPDRLGSDSDYSKKPTAGPQSSSARPVKNKISLRPHYSASPSSSIHCPEQTAKRSLSLLPSFKQNSVAGSLHQAKRKKVEAIHEEEEKEESSCVVWAEMERQKEDQRSPELNNRTLPTPGHLISKKKPPHHKVWSAQNGDPSQHPNGPLLISTTKKKNRDNKEEDEMDRHDAEVGYKAAPMWSVDPAAALSLYDTQSCTSDEERAQSEEHMDTDCTFVSHTLLQRQAAKSRNEENSMSGLGQKATDSLDKMFDTTAYGEYMSCTSTQLNQSKPCGGHDDDDDDDDDDGDDDEKKDDEPCPPEISEIHSEEKKAGAPTFAHVAVIRKKEERRKLKGSTCKECDVYYSHLPAEERQKKLSACSRHRFLYVPPSTPENFWEVGFPSTQTCIERGYIKEEKNPQARLRRRHPFNALFSQKH